MYKFKIILVGNEQVGKSTFLSKHLYGDFNKIYKPTTKLNVQSLKFQTNRGDILFDIWEISSEESLSGFRDGYFIGADGVILFFDVNKDSVKDLNKWKRSINAIIPNAKTIICQNKVDLAKKCTTIDKYIDISVKLEYNLDKPFLELSKKLLNDENVQFIYFVD